MRKIVGKGVMTKITNIHYFSKTGNKSVWKFDPEKQALLHTNIIILIVRKSIKENLQRILYALPPPYNRRFLVHKKIQYYTALLCTLSTIEIPSRQLHLI